MSLSHFSNQIGGIPFGIKCLRYRLPTHRKGRTDGLRPVTLMLTYISFALFSAARRPITVVQLKIIKECDAYVFGVNKTDKSQGSNKDSEESDSTESSVTSWCKGTVFEKDAQTFMQILGSLFIGSYGILVFFSGIIADYFNPRYIITWGSLMAGFFMIVIGMANLWKIESTQYFSMALILLAAAHSTAWPILLSCATHWYQGQRRGLFFSLWNTHFYVGSFIGILLAGSNVQEQWGHIFFFPATFVMLMGIILFFFLVIHPTDVAELDPPKVSNDQDKVEELPQWLDSKKTIPYYETFLIPGVLEFSGTMFFTRMVSFFFLFWRPAFLLESGKKTLRGVALYSLPYIIGGFLGGLCIGISKDIFRKNALVCVSFLLLSIPAIGFQMIQYEANIPEFDIFLQIILGLFVEAPYILMSTSVSVELGTLGILRRGHRGLATIASIVEGVGALGATVGPIIIVHMSSTDKWSNNMIVMIIMEILAIVCLSRMAYKDYLAASKSVTFGDYWRKGAAVDYQM